MALLNQGMNLSHGEAQQKDVVLGSYCPKSNFSRGSPTESEL